MLVHSYSNYCKIILIIICYMRTRNVLYRYIDRQKYEQKLQKLKLDREKFSHMR
jgi:hypothetical protein